MGYGECRLCESDRAFVFVGWREGADVAETATDGSLRSGLEAGFRTDEPRRRVGDCGGGSRSGCGLGFDCGWGCPCCEYDWAAHACSCTHRAVRSLEDSESMDETNSVGFASKDSSLYLRAAITWPGRICGENEVRGASGVARYKAARLDSR